MDKKVNEKEIITGLSRTSEMALKHYKKQKIIIIISNAVLIVLLLPVVGLSYLFEQYDVLICAIGLLFGFTVSFRIIKKYNKKLLLCELFVSNELLNFNEYTYDEKKEEFLIETVDNYVFRLSNVCSAFLVFNYIMLASKDNSIAILILKNEIKEKFLGALYKNGTVITSYDKSAENVYWRKKCFNKILLQIIPLLCGTMCIYLYFYF